MRAVVQRVARARVTVVDGSGGGAIGPGLCILLGVAAGDDEAAAEQLAGKVARLRIFEADDGRFDRSLVDTGGAALVVSQFTLIADSRRRRELGRASTSPRRPDVAEPIYERFCEALRAHGVPVETGVFGARMQLEIVNDGPVTIVLDAGVQPA